MAEAPAPAVVDAVPSYDAFLREFLLANRPVLLPPALVEHWPAFARWAAGGSVNWDALCADYGDHEAPVVVGGERTTMRVADVVRLIQSGERGPVYIKDWHLVRSARSDAGSARPHDPLARRLPYPTPRLFADDWMNNVTPSEGGPRPFSPDNWLATHAEPYDPDDFRFCYAGSAGSSTPLHRDVYTSYSWSTNIAGRKRWRLFPPHAAPWLRRFPAVRTSELAASTTDMDARLAAGRLGHVRDGRDGWPMWEEARKHMYTLEQGPGQTIFVPSNWYHEVENLTDCVSLNHNWCNSVNLLSMYDAMEQETDDVAEALSDVRAMLQETDEAWRTEFTRTVQFVVQQDSGWAWDGFWRMVQRNLVHASCTPDLHPPDAFIHERVRALHARFTQRPEYPSLDAGVAQAAAACAHQAD